MSYIQALKEGGLADVVLSAVILPIEWPLSEEQISNIGAPLGHDQATTFENILQSLKQHATNAYTVLLGPPIFPWQDKEGMFVYFLYDMQPEQAEHLFEQTAGQTLQTAFPLMLTTTERAPLAAFAFSAWDPEKPEAQTKETSTEPEM